MKTLSLALLVPLAACGAETTAPDSGDDDPTPQTVTYYQDVKPLLDAKCAQCHYDGGIAPFSLTSFDDAKLHAGVAQLAIDEGIMPPWPPDPTCAEHVGDRSLTAEQKELFAAWVAAGTPEGDAAAPGAPLPDDQPSLSRVDRTLGMTEDYTPVQSPDDYRCFLVPWPEEATAFVTGFNAVPGNDAIVHHVIAFLATPDMVATYEAMDADDAGPGYTCFGGTGGPARQWIGAWAPGGLGADLPPGTGMRVEPGSLVILQVHYNTLAGDGQPDRTAIQLKLDAEVDKEAWVQPFANPQWLAGGMKIAADDADATHAWSFDITAVAGGGAVEVYSSALHMHYLGTRGQLSIERADGTTDCLLRINDWDFDWQGSYGYAAPKLVAPGDELRIECHWDNTPENQPMVNGVQQMPRDVYWGEGTTDEMCLGVFLIAEQ